MDNALLPPVISKYQKLIDIKSFQYIRCHDGFEIKSPDQTRHQSSFFNVPLTFPVRVAISLPPKVFDGFSAWKISSSFDYGRRCERNQMSTIDSATSYLSAFRLRLRLSLTFHEFLPFKHVKPRTTRRFVRWKTDCTKLTWWTIDNPTRTLSGKCMLIDVPL